MKKHTIWYLYDDKVKTKNNEKYFTVYKVKDFGDAFEAERRARTIARKHGSKLAGGCFRGNCKPYNFKTNYKVIEVPDNTRLSPITKHDKFIFNLIIDSGDCDNAHRHSVILHALRHASAYAPDG